MLKANFHTHCTYCDGKEPLSKFVEQALKLGFDRLGFSSHAPIAKEDHDFVIKETEIPNYLRDIELLQKENPDITLFKALECDFIPNVTQPFHWYAEKYGLDYIIGSVHLVRPCSNSDQLWFIDGSHRKSYDNGLQQLFQGDIRKAVTAFWEQTFEMIETQKFDIIAHIDKIKMYNQRRFFTQTEKWYLNLIDHALTLICQKDIIIEINSRGLYKGRCDEFYPSDYILEKMGKMGIRSLFSSDAHLSADLNLFYEEAMDKLQTFKVEIAENFPFK